MTCVSMFACAWAAGRILDLGGEKFVNWRGARLAVGVASIGFGLFYAAAA